MRAALLFSVLAFACSCASRRPSSLGDLADECSNSVCARVYVTNDDIATVALEIPSKLLDGRDSIDLRFPEAMLGPSFLSSVTLADGTPWPNVFPVPRSGLSIRYEVKLDRMLGVPAELVREWSFHHPRGWHLKGYQIIPEIRVDAPAIVHFDVSNGEEVLAPLPSLAPGRFHAKHALELARSSYELGDANRVCGKIDAVKVCVASSVSDESEELSALMDLTASALRAGTARLGKLDERYVLVSHHARGKGSAYGITIGSAVTLFSPEAPSRAIDQTGFVLIHELLHLWLPGSRSIRPLWLREGLTEYMAYQTVADMTGVPDSAFAGWVSEAYRRYRTARYDIVIADTADELVYPAGVVAGFCLDRELGAQGSSTSEIIRALLAGAEDRSTTAVTEDWFLAELSRVSPKAAGYFKLLISERRFNFSNCMMQVSEAR